MKRFTCIFFLLGFAAISNAQRVCNTPEYNREFFQPAASKGSGTNIQNRDTANNELIAIPVVIHLLYNTTEQNISNEQLLSQVDVLNRDFRRQNTDALNTPYVFKSLAADTRISFCLAKVDPTGRPCTGIVRKHTNNEYFLVDDGMKFSKMGGDDAWDSKKYLNIWVCYLFGRTLGYATPPGGPTDVDGVVINYNVFGDVGILRYPFNKGRTATHEVGHWFGLKHLWGDTNCGNDDVDDTPRQLSYNFNCPSFPHVTGCSPNSNGDMFMNFMDFTDDACMNMFTQGQKLKMRSLFATGGIRNSFLDAFACDSTLATGAPLPDEPVVVDVPVADVHIYPNPAQNMVTLEAINNFEMSGKTCIIYSTTGVKLMQQALHSNKEQVSVSNLAAGCYILKIGEGADKKISKFIKL